MSSTPSACAKTGKRRRAINAARQRIDFMLVPLGPVKNIVVTLY
jgi:hypothetical protein